MKINVKKMNSLILALIPWLGNYRSFIPGLSIGQLLLVFSFFFTILITREIKLNNFKTGQIMFLIYILYFISITGISFLTGNILNSDLVLKRSIVLGFYLVYIFFMIPKEMEFNSFLKYYKNVVYFACFAMLMQYVGYYLLGSYFEFKIPFLEYSSVSAEVFDYSIARINTFRPDSIFLEPAHYTNFLVGYLVICLFLNSNKPKLIEAAVISIFMLMSVSSTAVFYLIVIWGYFIITSQFIKGTSIRNKIIIAFLSIIIIYSIIAILLNTNLFYSVNRLGGFLGSQDASNAWNKLFSGKEEYINLNTFHRIFGIGLENYRNPIFTTSVFFILYSTGIVGGIIFGLWFLYHAMTSNHLGRMMLIITLMLFTVWYLLYSDLFILYNVIIINTRFDTKINKVKNQHKRSII